MSTPSQREMPTPAVENNDPGIRAGTAKGIPYLVIIVFLSISFYKCVLFYGNHHDANILRIASLSLT